MTRFAYWGVFACCVVAGHGPAAWAQRAGENVLESAEDAFGTTLGNESIGLYTSRDVRGFDPVDAGNVRLEGLYFDRVVPNPNEILTAAIVSGSSVRVGLSAQSYLFPAPTGIADVSLRTPGDEFVTSAVAQFGAYHRMSLEVNSDIPVVTDSLSVMLGASFVNDDNADGARPKTIGLAGIGRWRPNDNVEVIPFYSYRYQKGMNPRPNIFSGGPWAPPRIPRHILTSQEWAINNTLDINYGGIINASLSDTWRLRTGLFRSFVEREHFYSNLFQNTRPNGIADNVYVSYPDQNFGAYSGEVRLSHVMTSGAFRHTFHVAGRGRIVSRNFNGAGTVAVGQQLIGITPAPIPRLTFTYRPLSVDLVRQGTAGVAYEGIWADVGEMSLGLQKTFYHRTLDVPATASSLIEDNPWLPNATLALHATDKVTVFGSYTRGLEEPGQAPNSAANRGEALPAIRTSQIDAGVRYKLTPRLTAVLTAFQIGKPYLSIDARNFFANVGDVRHRGFEFSLAGQVADGLRVVAGAVLLQARLSGTLVDQGLLGRVPIGRTPRFTRLDVEYGPKSWNGLSFDVQADNRSSRIASADNLVRLPSRTILSLGGHYRFEVADVPASLRFQVRNVFDTFSWDINISQLNYQPEEQRRYLMTLAVDF